MAEAQPALFTHKPVHRQIMRSEPAMPSFIHLQPPGLQRLSVRTWYVTGDTRLACLVTSLRQGTHACAGSAMAVEAADVALFTDDLRCLEPLLTLARLVRRKVLENVIFAVALKVGAVSIVAELLSNPLQHMLLAVQVVLCRQTRMILVC